MAQVEVPPSALSVAMLQLRAKDSFGLTCPAHEVLLTNSHDSSALDSRQALTAAIGAARAASFPVMLCAAQPEEEEEEEEYFEGDFENAGFLRQLVQLPLMQRIGEAWGIDSDDVFEVIDRFEAGAEPPRPAIQRLCDTVATRLGMDTAGMAEAVEEAFEGGQELLTSLQEEIAGVEIDYEEDEEDEQPAPPEVQLCFNVDCIACGRSIVGELFSCSVCPHTVFCATCEAQNSQGAVHSLRHPLMKVRHPAAMYRAAPSAPPAPVAPPVPSRAQYQQQVPVVVYEDSSDSESESEDEFEAEDCGPVDARLASLEQQIAQLQLFLTQNR